MYQKDIDLEHQAKVVAGNPILMRAAPQRFGRIPGLEGVHLVRRLDHFDFNRPKPLLSSNVFNVSSSQVRQTFNRIKSREPFGGFIANTILRPLDDYLNGRELYKGLRQPESGYMKTYDYIETDKQGKKLAPYDRRVDGVAVESNPLQTRQEMIAHYAGCEPEEITQRFNFSHTDKRAFVDAHELQHARSIQLWAEDLDGYKEKGTSPLVEANPAYAKLWEKAATTKGANDLYSRYLQEDMSDTVAVLHHLKAGGHIDMVQAIADARALGHIKNPAEEYASFRVLDEIVKDEENVRTRLLGASTEEMENMAAKLVGAYSMDRTTFYANAIAVGQQHAKDGMALGDEVALDYGMMITEKHLKQFPEEQHESVLILAEKRRAYLEARQEWAMDNLAFNDMPLSVDEQKIEVLAAIRHAQDVHPEFKGPQGSKYLLDTRKRMIDHTYGGGTDLDVTVCNHLEQHFERQAAAAPDRSAPGLEAEHTHERS